MSGHKQFFISASPAFAKAKENAGGSDRQIRSADFLFVEKHGGFVSEFLQDHCIMFIINPLMKANHLTRQEQHNFWLRHIWSLPTYNLTYQFWGLGLPLPSNGGSGDPNYSTAVHHLKALPFIVETLVIEYTEGIDGIKPHEAREVVAEWGMPKYKYHQIRVRHSKQHMGKYNPTKN